MSTKSEITDNTLKEIEKLTGPLTLGRLIWSIRVSDEISEEDFAKLLNISKQQLCELEKNEKPVRPELAARYARYLGYSEKQFVKLALQQDKQI
tara:strand:+ start:1638 stop:1919 length:282 start_codon:yes stop_codon:yes gene_type:complete